MEQRLPPTERELLAREALRRMARRPFDLARGPLLRAVLVQFDRQSYQLLLALHHSVFDGWSAGLLMDELGALYQAFVAGQPSPLADLPVQYGDFAVWQRRYLQGQVLQEHRAYWQAQFQGDLPVLALPGDWPRPAAQSHRGAELARCLPAALVEALERLARELDASLFMVLLAAFQTLLGRYAGQTDLVVGVPVANRSRGALERLIGFFVNTLPLRVNLAGDPTFRELMAQVRQVALGAYRHQDLPLDKIVEGLNLERHLSHSPLFQAMFVLQNMPLEVVRCADVTLCFVEEMDTGTAKFDLTLFVEFPAQGPLAIVEYNTDLFRASTIGRLLEHYQTLLAGVAADPQRRLADLPLLTPAERAQLLVAWNDSSAARPRDECLPELFARQAARVPDTAAMTFADHYLTFGALNRRANQLAHYLRGLGVGPEALVGLCLGRSVEMLVGLWGVLKAGAAYVPLDPTLPGQRLALLWQDIAQATAGAAPVLLSQRQFDGLLPQNSVRAVYLDADWPAIARQPATDLASGVLPENLAYLIFTSGSTGWPKGVAVEQRSLVNYVRAIVRRLNVAYGASFGLVSTFAADLGHTVLFVSFCTGGRLDVVSQEQAADPPALAVHFARRPVDYLKIVPSHLAALLEAAHPEHVLPRHCLVLGGEAASWALIHQVRQLAPHCRIVNHYGPTESTVGVLTCSLAPGEIARRLATVPLGRPLANIQIYVLDGHLRLAPVGLPGELCIAGAGLARGYLNHPALTAGRFVPDPFGAVAGGRLYRTGDLARFLDDGSVEFLGRTDDQVKVRGFRIELGEIEAALGRHPAVQEAIVLAREDEPGDRRLAAYVVFQSRVAAVEDLRRFLAQNLPDYMLPSAFVALDALPLTANGKIDRRALPPPGREQMAPESAYAAPGTPFEEIVAEIWGEVLRLEKVSVHDNFFLLGGHSLLVTQVVSRVRDRFEIELPLRCFFESPTVAQMASRVERALIEEIRAM